MKGATDRKTGELDLFGATPANPLDLPERVRVLSLWGRWCSAVRSGLKGIETRRWPWPYEPGWLALHAAQRWDGEIAGRLEPFPEVAPVEPGALCCLVWVAGCRPLVLEDRAAALLYVPGLWAWPLERVKPLRPVAMRGPQKFASVERAVILAALEAP